MTHVVLTKPKMNSERVVQSAESSRPTRMGLAGIAERRCRMAKRLQLLTPPGPLPKDGFFRFAPNGRYVVFEDIRKEQAPLLKAAEAVVTAAYAESEDLGDLCIKL